MIRNTDPKKQDAALPILHHALRILQWYVSQAPGFWDGAGDGIIMGEGRRWLTIAG
jgi:hypothetical protein